MAQDDRAVFLEVSRRLNEDLAALTSALAGGRQDQALAERARAGALAGADRLRALGVPTGSLARNIPKVLEHLDLFVTTTSALGAAPGLVQKLLDHLLDEQREITAEEEAALSLPGEPGTAAPGGGAAPGRGLTEASTKLSGDRKPFTVGSLIGR